MGFKLAEAIAQSEANGKKIKKKDLAAKLWPDSSETTQQVNMTNMLGGKTKRIPIWWISVLCAELGCDANYLFNVKTYQHDRS